jgi:hypothetical protein
MYRGIYTIYLELCEKNLKDYNMYPVGLENTRIFNWSCPKFFPNTIPTYKGLGRSKHFIALFKSLTMLCGTDNILQKISHVERECGKYSAKYYE